jgi:hypothetical protein
LNRQDAKGAKRRKWLIFDGLSLIVASKMVVFGAAAALHIGFVTGL